LFHRRTPIMLSFGHAKDWTLAKYHGFRKQTRWFWFWNSEIGGQARMGVTKIQLHVFPAKTSLPSSFVLTRIKWFMVWDNKKKSGCQSRSKVVNIKKMWHKTGLFCSSICSLICACWRFQYDINSALAFFTR